MKEYKEIINKQFIFHITQTLIKIFCRKNCRIESIEYDNNDGKYIVLFVYISKRQPFRKSSSEIFTNPYLLEAFKPSDAALIGFYHFKEKAARDNQQIINHTSSNPQ